MYRESKTTGSKLLGHCPTAGALLLPLMLLLAEVFTCDVAAFDDAATVEPQRTRDLGLQLLGAKVNEGGLRRGRIVCGIAADDTNDKKPVWKDLLLEGY